MRVYMCVCLLLIQVILACKVNYLLDPFEILYVETEENDWGGLAAARFSRLL
jgi:hypothetical protein